MRSKVCCDQPLQNSSLSGFAKGFREGYWIRENTKEKPQRVWNQASQPKRLKETEGVKCVFVNCWWVGKALKRDHCIQQAGGHSWPSKNKSESGTSGLVLLQETENLTYSTSTLRKISWAGELSSDSSVYAVSCACTNTHRHTPNK